MIISRIIDPHKRNYKRVESPQCLIEGAEQFYHKTLLLDHQRPDFDSYEVSFARPPKFGTVGFNTFVQCQRNESHCPDLLCWTEQVINSDWSNFYSTNKLNATVLTLIVLNRYRNWQWLDRFKWTPLTTRLPSRAWLSRTKCFLN